MSAAAAPVIDDLGGGGGSGAAGLGDLPSPAAAAAPVSGPAVSRGFDGSRGFTRVSFVPDLAR